MSEYDLLAFGNMSLDVIKTPDTEYSMIGGAILHAVWTAHQLGRKVAVVTKTSKKDKNYIKEFPSDNVDIFWVESKETTSIKNYYPTADKETRICTSVSQADGFKIMDFPPLSTKLVQYSGLITGEIDFELMKSLSNKAFLAVDVQGLIRSVEDNGSMGFKKWNQMNEALPYTTYLKADAAEAEFLLGIKTDTFAGRREAAYKFVELGASEVIISHNEGLIACSEDECIKSPFKNKNLKGRTGRGDTSFTTYITERLEKDMVSSIQYAAALASIKMENPGPFKKTRKDVEELIEESY
ncbi:MAG: ribokinase [Candidatus Lokiarchaeota archaeon]|nr:ribokinase [Candidatus Lokiarchaeota archaeon]